VWREHLEVVVFGRVAEGCLAGSEAAQGYPRLTFAGLDVDDADGSIVGMLASPSFDVLELS